LPAEAKSVAARLYSALSAVALVEDQSGAAHFAGPRSMGSMGPCRHSEAIVSATAVRPAVAVVAFQFQPELPLEWDAVAATNSVFEDSVPSPGQSRAGQ
jgi:hypothetical protein